MTIFFSKQKVQIFWFKRSLITSIMVGMKNDTATLKNRMTASSKVKHLSTPKYSFKRKKNIWLHKDVYVNVHSNFIENNQNPETIQMHINLWMYKQILYLHVMEYYSVQRNKLLIRYQIGWISRATY